MLDAAARGASFPLSLGETGTVSVTAGVSKITGAAPAVSVIASVGVTGALTVGVTGTANSIVEVGGAKGEVPGARATGSVAAGSTMVGASTAGTPTVGTPTVGTPTVGT